MDLRHVAVLSLMLSVHACAMNPPPQPHAPNAVWYMMLPPEEMGIESPGNEPLRPVYPIGLPKKYWTKIATFDSLSACDATRREPLQNPQLPPEQIASPTGDSPIALNVTTAFAVRCLASDDPVLGP